MFIQPSVLTALIRLGNVSDIELYDAAVSAFRTEHKGFSRAGSYKRDLITISHGSGKYQQVTIIRFRSPDGTTNAVLPDLIVPGSSYSLRFILHVLYYYLKRTCTVNELCGRFQISVSTLYAWIHLFESHYASWARSIFNAGKLHMEMLAIVHAIPSFPSLFLSTFHHPFMKPGTCPEPFPALPPP